MEEKQSQPAAEKPFHFGTRGLFLSFTVILALACLTYFAAKPCPKPNCPYETRVGDFYVGMTYDEAKEFLPRGSAMEPLGALYKQGPRKGDIVAYVLAERGNGKLAL